ncbi:GspH/FimT family pseudopilin [Methylococcus capsulatus]|uniref:GspH/FimT family pseudopilin n=2 Tax=Methylococcus capsulatus TaxID=414 RepID=UPI00211B05F5|nr:GspH/FimT family pseudopilin [Methylococcus capsulatus]
MRSPPLLGSPMRRTAAFTLIELMIGIALAAVLLTVGIPGFRDLILDNRMAAQINSLVADLSYARSEAVKRNSEVTVCKRNTAGTGCDDSKNWTDGWIVVAGATVLRVHDPVSSSLTMTIKYTGSNRVVYGGKGFLSGVNNGTFIFCDSRGYTKARGLVLAMTGRLRTTRDDDGNQIQEKGSNGVNLSESDCQ